MVTDDMQAIEGSLDLPTYWSRSNAYATQQAALSRALSRSNEEFSACVDEWSATFASEGLDVVGLHSESGSRAHFLIQQGSHIKTRKLLRGHTEAGFLSFPSEAVDGCSRIPEFLLLYCIANPDRLSTSVLGLDEILQHLPSKTEASLRGENYTFKPQTSFDINPSNYGASWRPALLEAPGGPYVRFSNSNMLCRTESAASAKRMVEGIFQYAKHEVSLSPGEMLIINNRRCLHGRGTVMPGSLEPRVLVRLYGYTDGSDIVRISHRTAQP